MTTVTAIPAAGSSTGRPAGDRRRPSGAGRDFVRIGLWIALVVWALIWAVPIIFMVFTSLKDEPDIFSTPAYVPPLAPEWGNYADGAERGDLVRAATNSLIIAAIKVPIGLAIAAAAAFALSRIRFHRAGVLTAVIALGAMVPIQIAIAPLFQITSTLGLLNTHLGVILPYIGFGLPYEIFILYGFFRQIPMELDESARIDGASNWRLFRQIILPLAKPALAALFILDFVATWNEYGIALALLQREDMWTIPLAIQGFQSQFTSSYGPLNAFTIMTVIPVLIVYLMFQKYFVQGALAGAVKG